MFPPWKDKRTITDKLLDLVFEIIFKPIIWVKDIMQKN